MPRHNLIVVSMVPAFDQTGNLPPGIHWATWAEVVDRFGNTQHRQRLLGGLRRALLNLHDAGCLRAYLDGSFVSDRDPPGDFDGCWELAGVDLAKVDRVLKTFANSRALQKAKYFGELFPAGGIADPAGKTFLDFFQADKSSGLPKGIVGILLNGVPR